MGSFQSWVESPLVSVTNLCSITGLSDNMLVIYEPDFIARRNCIQGCLSERDRLGVSLRQRVRRHEALIAHMEIAYSTACKTWYRRPCAHEKGEEKSGRASMKTQESRNEFVRKGLEHERALMHTKGSSESMAIEID